MKSVLASYTLSLAVFIPISGWMADRFGTRVVFASAIGLFTLGSVLCGVSSDIHLLVVCRILQGCGGAMMVPVGRLTLVRTFAKSELIRAMSFVAIPALVGPMLGPIAGGLIVDYLHWRFIFFVNLPIGMAGLVLVHLHLPDYREQNTHPLDIVGLILFGSGIALLSYVLEIFGEHSLGTGEILGLLALSLTLITGYGLHAGHIAFPLLQLGLFHIRTFSAAVRAVASSQGLASAACPSSCHCSTRSGSDDHQVPHAAHSRRRWLSWRADLKHRDPCLLLMLFATVGPATPLWLIVLQAFCYGAFTSLQYTSMNTLVYADIDDEKTSAASSIASTVQQMSISFGVAAAGLTTALFIPDSVRSDPFAIIRGIHAAFLALGGLTILSAIVFCRLRSDDGSNVSRHTDLHLH